MRTFGSGQTNGLPLLITGITLAAAQVIHTFPVGSATPHRVRLCAVNLDDNLPHTLNVAVYNSSGTLIGEWPVVVRRGADGFDLLADHEIVMNGTAVLKVYADAASALAVTAVVDDQGDVAGIASQNIASGLIAAVRNASRFAVGAMGGVGQATRANGEIVMARAGTLRNLRAVADTTIGGGATVTVSVFKNGVTTGLSIALAAADTTVAVTDTDSITVAAGDKITFSVATDDAGAPAANIQACVELV